MDNVVFTNDGKTYLDNKQVIVTDSEGNEILHNMFAEPKVGYSIYYKKHVHTDLLVIIRIIMVRKKWQI